MNNEKPTIFGINVNGVARTSRNPRSDDKYIPMKLAMIVTIARQKKMM
jgi:hypothetical protein